MKKTILFVGSVIILILSAITFIFIPAIAQTGTANAPVFGKYDGKAIELAQGTPFANAVLSYEDSAKADLARVNAMPQEQQDYYRTMLYYQIYSNAFNAAVHNLAYTAAVKKSGWEPATQQIAREIVQIPRFFENGAFSVRQYNSISESDRTNLKKSIYNQLIWERFSDDVFGSNTKLGTESLFGIKSADAELDFIAKQGAEKRSFDLAAFDKESYPDTEVTAYGNEHKELFTKFALSVITLDDEKEAKDVLAKIENGEISFADALSYSEKYYSNSEGKMNATYRYQLASSIPAEEDLTAVTALAKDATSGVVATARGFSIFRCDGDAVEPDFTDAALKDTVKSYIKQNDSGLIEEYFLGIAKNFAAAAVTDGFESACKQFKTERIAVPAFALNYGNASVYGSIPSEVTQLSGAATNENFLEKAFSLKNGEVSQPILLGNNVIVVKLTGVQTDSTAENKSSLASDLSNYDQSAAQYALLTSDKVENNVSQAFFKYVSPSRSN
ncbi:MAG: peptidyl-prolyl cis-trans isomerase [Treponema sp.]|nr:peptidyl-prolyl cis-trans isomerase [Treponema sp.]